MLLLVHLEHLQNEFQLQRLLCRQQGCASDALIDISMRMLTAVMILPSIQLDSVYIHRDRTWIVRTLPRTFLPIKVTDTRCSFCTMRFRALASSPSTFAHACGRVSLRA